MSLRGELWRHPDFLKLWGAQAVSAMGSRITREGLPLTAVLLLGATAGELGLLVALAALPGVLLSPFAGAWIDRTRRRRVLILADIARALLLATVPLAAWWGWLSISQIVLVAAAVATFSMLFEIADNAYLPSLVGRDQLLEGNTKLATTDAVAEVGGPALAGLLVQLLTAPVAILVDALSYLWSALLLATIRRPEAPLVTGDAPPDLKAEIREGLSAVFRHPVLRPLTLCLATATLFGNFFAPLYVLYAVRELGLDPALLGLTIAMGGVGALIGAPLAGWLGARVPVGRLLIAARLAYGLAVCLIPLADGPPWTAAAVLMVSQVLGDGLHMVFFTNLLTLRQRLTPDRLLGRVGGSTHMLLGAMGLVAALLAGWLADAIGLRPTLWIAAAGILASTLWLLVPAVRRLGRLDGVPPAEAAHAL
ncbi:MAG TPA: MFS transporter [Alphaproteobacteria bacterium]|nr:MFS transporter [Alphaproteobacteria bacterium]